MSLFKFIVRSLWYFRKQNIALLIGTAITTAVLTGALIVGDSVNFSLRQIVTQRLGKTEFALISGTRFVRAELSNEIAAKYQTNAASILILQGIAINPDSGLRINKSQVIGIDSSFWEFSHKLQKEISDNEAIISENVAQKLLLHIGDEILIRIENATIVPINTPLVSVKKPSVAFRFTVKTIVNDSCLGRFSLQNNQLEPYNIFVSRNYLSKKLNLKGLSNCMLVTNNDSNTLNINKLNSSLSQLVQITDLGLKQNRLSAITKNEITSSRIFIDKPISHIVSNLKIPHESVLTYLVNSIRFRNSNTPYSFVTAASVPIVPFDLKPNEIIINNWLANDLNVLVGDTLNVDYYVIGPLRTLNEETTHFVVKKILPVDEYPFDKSLMPSFPGMTDAGNCRDWDSGIPIDLKRIRDKDEKYWDNFRGTPKAFISIHSGIKLWSNPFGNYTAFRFDTKNISSDSLSALITANLKLSDIGISFVSVRNKGISAANNSVDFGELFLSLSFFLLVAAFVLTVLIYSLHIDSRNKETAILMGIGFSKKIILRIRLTESIVVIVFGSILGAIVGIAYNFVLIGGLNSIWNDAIHTNMLQVSISGTTLLIGSLSGIIIAILSIFFITRKKLKQSIVSLFRNFTFAAKSKSNKRFTKILVFVGIIGALVCVVFSISQGSTTNPTLFLMAGALFLMGSISAVSLFLFFHSRKSVKVLNINQIALLNLGRNKSRSATIIIILALGTFSIVLTGSYRKTFVGTENKNPSGTGGYELWTETTMPIPFDLNSVEGQSHLDVTTKTELDSVRFMQIYTMDGDDASCLNLNQVTQPRILGIDTYELDKRQAFSFGNLLSAENSIHPWLQLSQTSKDSVYPAFADQTVIQYGLKKKIGDTLFYTNEHGKTIRFRLMGGLDNSIFQGSILISKDVFVKLFPSMGTKIILVDVPTSKQETIAEMLHDGFVDYGMETTTTTKRLSEFNSVENTYLTVFMILGGLGVLLGIVGMCIILYRNMLERKHELALLLSLGFMKKDVFRMVIFENTLLLSIGIVCGLFSAIIAIVPSLVSPTFVVQWQFLGLLISSFFVVGFAIIWVLVRVVFKSQLIDSLRNE